MKMFVIYIIFTIGGLILMKLGGGQLSFGFKDGMIKGTIGVKLLLAFIMYGISFIVWSSIVAKNDLTYIMPIASAIVNILSVIVGVLIFKEVLSTTQVLGIIIATIGIIMMNIK